MDAQLFLSSPHTRHIPACLARAPSRASPSSQLTAMGVDYSARKAAKKARKAEGRLSVGKRTDANGFAAAGGVEEGGKWNKRDRPKHGRKGQRRMCKGMCYGKAPLVSKRERRLRGGGARDGGCTNACRRGPSHRRRAAPGGRPQRSQASEETALWRQDPSRRVPDLDFSLWHEPRAARAAGARRARALPSRPLGRPGARREGEPLAAVFSVLSASLARAIQARCTLRV